MPMMQEIDFIGKPKKTVEELEVAYPKDLLLVMTEVLSSQQAFRIVFQDLIDILKYGYEHEEVRHREIFYKFKRTDKKTRSLPLNRFVGSLIFWFPLIEVDRVKDLDETWIFPFDSFDSDSLMDFCNNKLLKVYDEVDADFASKNAMIDNLYHYIISLSRAFCLLMGMGVNIYDLHQLEQRNPEVSHIMRDPVDTSKEPKDIEKELNDRNDRLIELLANDPEGNDYQPFFRSKTGLKKAQFREYLIMIGFKADINGNTIPVLITDSFLLNGLSKPSFLYINAMSGRKALILTKLCKMAA